MALSPMYAAILQDLNKAVASHQPEDVLQFCANWFNAKLEEQRIAGRLSIAQAEAAAVGAGGLSGRSKSFSAAPGHGLNGIRKKGSLPSLVGQGYQFGSSGKPPVPAYPGQQDFDSFASGPSPYSEHPPNTRSLPSIVPPSHRNPAAPAHPSPGIHWNRSFGGSVPGSTIRGDDMQDSDEENLRSDGSGRPGLHSRDSESRDRLAPLKTSALDNGIPSGYNLGRRTSVSAESIDPNSASNHSLPKTVIPKTASQRARIESSIEKNLLFRNLDEEQHDDVLNAMKEVHVTKGTEVIVQGAVGDFFYVVESGEFQVWVKPQAASGIVLSPPPSAAGTQSRGRSMSPNSASREPQENRTVVQEDGSSSRGDGAKLVATISSGGSFGELALMYNAPRAATVVCHSEEATLWALDRVTFRTILMEHTSKKRRMYEKFLAEVPILLSLEAHERSKIADALEERVYEEGEDVVREGELGKNFYIIESGRAEVLKKKGDKIERVGTLSKGDYFGELALLNSAPRAATVRPMPGSGRLRVATLGEKAFTRLLGPVVEILTRRAERNYGPSAMLASPVSAMPTPTSAGRREEAAFSKVRRHGTPKKEDHEGSRGDRDRDVVMAD